VKARAGSQGVVLDTELIGGDITGRPIELDAVLRSVSAPGGVVHVKKDMLGPRRSSNRSLRLDPRRWRRPGQAEAAPRAIITAGDPDKV
jgi:hypothetical protein